MEIQGERILAEPRTEVWRALNNPAVLQRSIPGCDTFEADGENKYRVAMQATVGPVRARFSGRLQLNDVVAPTSYAMTFEGSGGVAGFGKGTAKVVLEDMPQGTRLRYSAQAQVGGRLAQVGARLIDGVTKRMADDFFTRFANELVAPKDAVTSADGTVPKVGVQATPVAVAQVAARTSTPSVPGSHVAVIAAAVSATAAAVAVLAAVFVLQFAR